MNARIFASVLIGCLLVSCDKDDDTNNTSYTNVIGFWKGKVGTGTAAPNTDVAFLFRSDGTFRVYNNSSDTTNAGKVDDIYGVAGTIINMNYFEFGSPYNKNMEGNINSSYTRIDGTWGAGAATTGGGTFYLAR
ncbi:MAG TPA: hypothetical protein VFZ78_02750 [Flavisolibacter sp.]